jgi:hypothetical protein
VLLSGCGEVTYEKAEEAMAYCSSKGLDTYTYYNKIRKQVDKIVCQDKEGREWPVQYKGNK